MAEKLTVLKFGGSSLEDASAFERVARIVCSCASRSRVVVVSAMSGMTDALLASATSAAEGNLDNAMALLETQITRHLAVARNLLPDAQRSALTSITDSQKEIEAILNRLHASRTLTPRLEDQIVSYGEQLSAKLLMLMLTKYGQQSVYIDARDCILTNEDHRAAQPLLEATKRLTRAALQPLLKTKTIPVLGGFFALSTNGATTTLGRGSSDYTATLVSAALDAHETQIWTDVNGVMSADPHLVETARPIPRLSYEEAAELARFGGKVLHPKTIQPVALTGIPLRVCNSRSPESRGTVVSRVLVDQNEAGIKAIAHKTGITVLEFASSRAFMTNGFRTAVERIFHEHHTTVDIVTKDAIAARLICEPIANLPEIIHDLERLGSVRVENDLAVICCVGVPAVGSLEAVPGIHWQRISTVSSVAFVPAGGVASLVSALHEHLIRNSSSNVG